MSFHKPPSKWESNKVDWSDPDLKALLDRSVGWTLDNRSGFDAQRVEVHIGWSAGGGRPITSVSASNALPEPFSLQRTESSRHVEQRSALPRAS